MVRFGFIMSALSAALLLTACSSPLDFGTAQALRDKAQAAAADDMHLAQRPDLSLPAFIETSWNGALDTPTCNAYCLRLLYTGEAQTVISGFATPNRQPDCVPPDPQPRVRTRNNRPDINIQFCDVFDSPIVKAQKDRPQVVSRFGPPQAWRDATPQRRAYIIWAGAYHLERRKTCPDANYHDISGDPPGPPSPQLDTIIESQIASGLCLIEAPAQLDRVTALFLFDKDAEHTYRGRNAAERKTDFNAYHLSLYGAANAGWPLLYRHTLSIYSYIPALAPSSCFDDACFDVSHRTEDGNLSDHLRTDIGLRLTEPKAANVDARQSVVRALNNPDLDFTSGQWSAVRIYLNQLQAIPPGHVSEADAALLARLVSDGRPTVQLRDLDRIVAANPQIATRLAQPLLLALRGFSIAHDDKGRPYLPGDREERQRIYEAGPGHRDLLNAGSERLDFLEGAVLALPDSALSIQASQYEAILDDAERLRFVPRLLSRASILPQDKAIPLLRHYIQPDPANARKDWSADRERRAALSAACHMGDKARVLIPDISAFVVSSPSQFQTEELQDSWAILSRFGYAKSLAARTRPNRDYQRRIDAGDLSCIVGS